MVTVKQLWLTIVTIATNFILLSGCPVQCQCGEFNQTVHVICVNESLEFVPDNIPITVTSLDLHGNHISSLTQVFQNFTQVQKIDLSANNLKAFQPEDFQNNSRLEYLNLENNELPYLRDNAFLYIPQLKALNLAKNSITSLNGKIFYALFNLEDLQLQGNQIINISSDSFLFTEAIVCLDLSHNAIRDLPENVFINLTTLIELKLQNNLLTTFDGEFLFSQTTAVTTLNLSFNNIYQLSNLTLTNLSDLDLSWNNFTSMSVDYFEHLENLTSLVLDGNPVTSIRSAVFEKLKNLRVLSMSYMPNLSYLSKSTFLGLDTLEVLKLNNNRHLSFIHKYLFIPLHSVSIIDLSWNSISSLHNETIFDNSHLSSLNLIGNNFTCNCAIEWLISRSQSNDSIILYYEKLKCVLPDSDKATLISDLNSDLLHCSDVKILNHSKDSAFRIGKSAILRCEAESEPSPEIIWITPHKRVLTYHNFHEFATIDYLHLEDQVLQLASSHQHQSYYSESESRPDRIKVLADGSLFIEFVMRGDSGPYKCVAKNPKNSTEVIITVTLDYSVLSAVKIWSLVVGFACAGGFFLLNLTYSLTLAAVRRCVSQRRRERIREILESMDQYKTAHLARIKENYNHQVGRIRDQYHYQLGRLREHHQNQMDRMGRMREGASQKVERLRDNYNNQLGRLKGYSSSQLLQLREKYNSQVDKMKDYGGEKLEKIHEKYKLKQQHVIKLIEMMNLDNCRTVFESECVRTESMILHSDLFPPDVSLNSPCDSLSPSDSEYVTASSSESSKYSSQENIPAQNNCETEDENFYQISLMNPYLPEDDNTDADNEEMYMNNDPQTSQIQQTMKYKMKHRQHKRRKKQNENADEREILHKDSCDVQNEEKETKECDTNEAKECNEPKEHVWHTSGHTMYGGSSHSVSQHSDPGPSGLRAQRRSKKRNKSSKSSHYLGQNVSEDVSVDMSDELFSWTIKESVV